MRTTAMQLAGENSGGVFSRAEQASVGACRKRLHKPERRERDFGRKITTVTQKKFSSPCWIPPKFRIISDGQIKKYI